MRSNVFYAVRAEGLHVGQNKRPSIYVRDNPIFSSERMLRKDYGRRGSVEKTLVMVFKGLGAKMN
jgi:hypothetical protein